MSRHRLLPVAVIVVLMRARTECVVFRAAAWEGPPQEGKLQLQQEHVGVGPFHHLEAFFTVMKISIILIQVDGVIRVVVAGVVVRTLILIMSGDRQELAQEIINVQMLDRAQVILMDVWSFLCLHSEGVQK